MGQPFLILPAVVHVLFYYMYIIEQANLTMNSIKDLFMHIVSWALVSKMAAAARTQQELVQQPFSR